MAHEPDPLLLERQLCFAVYDAAHAFSAAYKPFLEPLGLTYSQYLILLVLWERDGLNVKEIGQKLQLDSGTLTPILKRLEALGHLKRTRDPKNERQLKVELTDKGRSLRTKAREARANIVCALGGSEDRVQELKRALLELTPRLREVARGSGSPDVAA